MRQHICKKCGTIYDTDKPESYLCPACAQQSRVDSVYRQRICTVCGRPFVGTPRAKYCEVCRPQVIRERNAAHKKSKTGRKLGSTDFCAACGKPYTVKSGLQKYCPECAQTQITSKSRARKRAYNAQHRDILTAYRKEMMDGLRVCVVCGNPFNSTLPTVTCSPECQKEQRRRRQAAADKKRRTKT